MSSHVPDDILNAFVEGEVGEQLAVHIAEHLDSCPACGTRAATLEPLSLAFAALDDPVVPPDLADSIVKQIAKPASAPLVELAVGTLMLGMAASLVLFTGNPIDLAVKLGMLANLVGALGSALSGQLVTSTLALVLTTALAAFGCFAAARVTILDRRLS